jgi:hypothetical protein
VSARSSVVNGVLTSPKERRSFKPKVESSILSGRIPRCSRQRRAFPGAEPFAPTPLESLFLAPPRRSGPFRRVLVSFLDRPGRRIISGAMADRAREKARADVRRVQAKIERGRAVGVRAQGAPREFRASASGRPLAGGYCLRRPQDGERTMSPSCRHNLGLVRLNSSGIRRSSDIRTEGPRSTGEEWSCQWGPSRLAHKACEPRRSPVPSRPPHVGSRSTVRVEDMNDQGESDPCALDGGTHENHRDVQERWIELSCSAIEPSRLGQRHAYDAWSKRDKRQCVRG